MSTDLVSMDQETLTALLGSIQKWQNIVDGKDIDRGCKNCPLCHKFNKDWNDIDHGPYEPDEELRNCEGYPVYQRTGKSNCAGSPYADDDFVPTQEHGMQPTKATAERELAFLRSLLPPDVTAVSKICTHGPMAPEQCRECTPER